VLAAFEQDRRHQRADPHVAKVVADVGKETEQHQERDVRENRGEDDARDHDHRVQHAVG
jgi:hypothetical protein